MKIIKYLISITVILGIYSCEGTTSTNQNPLTYSQEQPYFNIEPFTRYSNIVNRIDYGIIKTQIQENDSLYIRATFYDKRKFRDAGNLYFGNIRINKTKADNIFNIDQLIEDFIDYGFAYFSEIDSLYLKDSLIVQTTGQEFPAYQKNITLLDTTLIIENLEILKEISKSQGLQLVTNDIGFDHARVRLYNSQKEYIFYSQFETELNFGSEVFNNIPTGKYKFECLKGHYILDTASNNEPLIINIYSSYTFDTVIKD
jgi:uncharacterized protein YutD